MTPITRKTLANIIGGDVNAERIRKNERTWGLDRCRVNTGTKSVLYSKDKAVETLRRRGF
jgi:hypothetical protein